MIEHPRSGEHYARVERERIEGETFLAALDRIAIEDAVTEFEAKKPYAPQTYAAKLLSVSKSLITRHLRRARELRGNVAAGRSDLNPTVGPVKPWSEARWEARYRKDGKLLDETAAFANEETA